ncbi:MAG: dihydropteroate synthase [Waddliaceae bacterium]|nr:dihydropteroate synthase [Waddliaceae bacterium]
MQKTSIMGILNVTPDSFFDGGQHDSLANALQFALEMVDQGADIIDIGGESTRPGAVKVSIEEEKRRVLPLIQALSDRITVPLSIDTRNAETAREALDLGASYINDVSGFSDPAMQELAASTDAKLVVMHMQKDPTNMQNNPLYPEGVIDHIIQWMEIRVEELLSRGVNKDQIILDPGIGFGKTVAHNLEILHNLHRFKDLGFPILVGASRKSFLRNLLQKPTEDLLSGTVVAHTLAVQNAANIIRVHDVSAHRDMLILLNALEKDPLDLLV